MNSWAEESCTGGSDYRGRPGHIPGALSIAWTKLADDPLMLRSAEELGSLPTATWDSMQPL